MKTKTFEILVRLVDSRSQRDPMAWGGRTMPVAHGAVRSRFDDIPTGSIVDVEFELGETDAPRGSDL